MACRTPTRSGRVHGRDDFRAKKGRREGKGQCPAGYWRNMANKTESAWSAQCPGNIKSKETSSPRNIKMWRHQRGKLKCASIPRAVCSLAGRGSTSVANQNVLAFTRHPRSCGIYSNPCGRTMAQIETSGERRAKARIAAEDTAAVDGSALVRSHIAA